MPSSKNYKRDYKQEYASEDKTRRKQRSMRNQARQEMISKGKAKVGDGKDVGHKRALSKGGGNTLANLAIQSRSSNRSFSRKSSGAMASETSKKERKKKR
jgi:hypothetical protein